LAASFLDPAGKRGKERVAQTALPRIGYACAYTPLAVIDAAGFAPYRLLPTGEWPEAAGRLLHDNLCPHVKRLLDRALCGAVPDLAGMVFMNSCDAMRRLADAWIKARPEDRVVLLDLPVGADETAAGFFGETLARLGRTLAEWGGAPVTEEALLSAVEKRDRLARLFERLRERHRAGALAGGAAALQAWYNEASTEPPDSFLERFTQEVEHGPAGVVPGRGVPVFLFGNVLPDPEAFTLFESCGVRIVDEDLCTGSRLFHRVEMEPAGDVFSRLARGLLAKPRCARSFDPRRPGRMGEEVVARARQVGAVSVIGHALKFCDPYLTRLPGVREALRRAGMPLLILEGDLSLRSIGQQRTRIEAFAEMQG
jgi:benzoyl-CoA reductase/2-hydroxyglutaryl-CoA dehydratase subunit BcrC/BadD/HgdB